MRTTLAGTALLIVLAMTGTAEAARVVVEYVCSNPRTYERLEIARLNPSQALFQARLQRALAKGECRLAGYRPLPSAVVVAPAKRVVKLKPIYEVGPAVATLPPPAVRVPVYSRSIDAHRFPDSKTFAPVR